MNKERLQIIVNPPYDKRIPTDFKIFYSEIGNTLKRNYDNTSSWIFTANMNAIKCIGLRTSKRIKLFKRGWRNLIRNPKLIFGKKENIITHFDMHHGYGNLSKAIKKLDNKDRDEFEKFVVNKSSYNPHIMFIARKTVLEKWFTTVFSWLERCEEEFGFVTLKGYDTERLYAYLAERYLSFWFTKYTSYREHPWAFIDF